MGAYRHIERGLLLLDQLGMGREVTSQAGLLISLAERNGEQQLEAQWRTFVAGLARHDVLLMASARNSEGLQARDAGQLDQARAAHLEALVSYQEAGVSGGVAFTETCLAFLALDRGDTAGAVRHLRAALPAAMSSSDDATLALALDGVAIAVCDGDPESSAALLGAASSFWSSSAAHARASHQDAVAVVAHRLREVLGTARFVTAYDRGAGCGRHEALTIAGSALRAGTSAQPQ